MGHNEGPAFQEKLAAACWLGQRTDAELASFGLGSEALCAALLKEQGVASTPGTDFEDSERGKTQEHIMDQLPNGRECQGREEMMESCYAGLYDVLTFLLSMNVSHCISRPWPATSTFQFSWRHG